MSAGALRCYKLMMWFHRRGQECFASVKWLAGKLACSTRQVKRWTRELGQLGYIRKQLCGPHPVRYLITSMGVRVYAKWQYVKFLKSKYWKAVREAVFAARGRLCERCQSMDNIEVHHLTYKHHRNELSHLEDLTVLCRDCHGSEHGIFYGLEVRQ